MKPNEVNAKYCLKNAKFVNGLLEGRGWQVGDWVCELVGEREDIQLIAEPPADLTLYDTGNHVFPLVWLPSEGDVLAILWGLETNGDNYNSISLFGDNDGYAAQDRARAAEGVGETRLIALLELLRVVSDDA